MQQHNLRITASKQDTVLERLLQVTRYRGFVVTGMTMFPSSDEQALDIELSVRSDKSVEHLQHQLNKLIDIKQIKVDNIASQHCIA